jgi:hypothetical protein
VDIDPATLMSRFHRNPALTPLLTHFPRYNSEYVLPHLQ